LRGSTEPLPVYKIDHAGCAHQTGELSMKWPQGTHLRLDAQVWPVPAESVDGWWDGLPYALSDMRPQGFMGRHFAHACHQRLKLPEDPGLWSDDDVLIALSEAGSDAIGDLIVGEPAFDAWQGLRMRELEPVRGPPGEKYVALAETAVAQGQAGSSAAGEFPKFIAARELRGAATPHVIVKFSGAEPSATVTRWSDLLVCEHLALQTMREALVGVAVASSRIVQHGGRTFMESERFDRHGDWGRSPQISLGTLDAALLGAGTNDWVGLAKRLVALRLMDASQIAPIERIGWFGRLIGNTDMHAGNLSFVPHGALSLAPAYDMLPMMYAPLAGGEVPTRTFEPALPKPSEREVWRQACEAALAFWREVALDLRVSGAFKAVGAAHARRLQEAADKV
jgi:hypothetical protein